MNANRKSRLMYSFVQNYFKDWDLSYWELDWVTTDDFREFADLFHITPKAGATPARTLYERLQKYHTKYGQYNINYKHEDE